MVIDLKMPEGAEQLRRLIATADVLVHNMRVSAIERLGFGYAAVAAINPRIVYCVATGFGQDGPHRDRPAFDDIIQAGCGLVGLTAALNAQPDYVPSLIADKTTGLALVNAVLAALFHRERHGVGQSVEVPMLETMASFALAEHLGGLTFEPQTEPAGYARLMHGGRRPAPTQDGWICALPYTERHWQAFFRSAGREDLAERFAVTDPTQRNANIRALYAAMAEITPARTSAEWMTVFEELDVPATPIYGIDELPRHPHLRAVGLFQHTQHPTEGALVEIRPTTRFSSTPLSLRRHAPTLGEHTAEVLGEITSQHGAQS